MDLQRASKTFVKAVVKGLWRYAFLPYILRLIGLSKTTSEIDILSCVCVKAHKLFVWPTLKEFSLRIRLTDFSHLQPRTVCNLPSEH